MIRKLTFVLAMALVLVSGAFVNSHAANLSGPPACWSFACGLPGLHTASATPAQMGTAGY